MMTQIISKMPADAGRVFFHNPRISPVTLIKMGRRRAAAESLVLARQVALAVGHDLVPRAMVPWRRRKHLPRVVHKRRAYFVVESAEPRPWLVDEFL